jgi:sugar phosphate isomerase/epimerase
MTTRRSVVKAIAALAATGVVPRAARAFGADALMPDRIERIGLQLYTVRSLMAKDMAGTLAAVAAAGYKEVEFAGYFGRAPAGVARLLGDNGLTAPSTHLSLDDLQERFDATADMARAIGIRYLTVASLDMRTIKTADDWKRIAGMFNDAGRRATAAGLRFAYHNHSVEFTAANGVIPMDILLAETDPALVSFEMDLYWAVKAGQDPRAYFTRYPGRFAMVHVKDATTAPALEMTDVGSGSIDWAAIFALHATAGIRHYFVEHDNPADPMASITKSAGYLKALTF